MGRLHMKSINLSVMFSRGICTEAFAHSHTFIHAQEVGLCRDFILNVNIC